MSGATARSVRASAGRLTTWVAALGGVALLLFVLSSVASAQQQPLDTATDGDVAYSFVGRIDQNGLLFVNVGYLTSAAGLEAADLFTGEDSLERSEATARITYFTSARLEERSVNENLFVTSGTGETTFYFLEDGGADYANPNSFKDGTPIATSTSVWHNTVNVQAPDTGIIFADSVDTLVTADRFTIAGEEHVLGQPDERLRLSYVGQGERTDVEAPRASFVYAGQATTLGSGETGAAPAVTDADDDSSVLVYVALALAVLALLLAVAALARRRGSAGRP